MALNIRALFGIGSTANVNTISVGPSSSSVLLLSNTNRKAFVIVNDTGTLYVKLGINANVTDYTQKIGAGLSWEVANYTGLVTARKASGTTSVFVTEIL